MPDVPMPRLSDSMEEGTLVRWLKADGEAVARGEEIAEIETDKATMAYEADAAGVLRHRVAEGATLPVGATIATIGDGDGDGDAQATDGDARAASEAAPPAAPAAPATPANGGAPAAPAAPSAAPPRSVASANGVSASPVARRAAQRLGVALAAVAGSGPRGRIVKADVVAASAGGAPAAPAGAPGAGAAPAGAAPGAPGAAPGTAPGGGKGATTVVALSRVQQTIARRMAESKATIPEFTLAVDVDMGAASALREQLRGAVDPLPSYNDLLVKAAALALRAHPRANGSYRDGAFELHARVNVGVAVAAPDALLVPTVFDADRRPLGEIARETRALAERARAGTLAPPELSGGTFTVSNLGMMGVDRFAGIVNPPQAAILCAGAIAPRALVGADGAIVARPVLTLTLVSDHRILYGADAAAFLAELRGLLERPLVLLAS